MRRRLGLPLLLLLAGCGENAGPYLVADVAPGPGSSAPQAMTVAGDRVFLVAGGQVSVTDGSTVTVLGGFPQPGSLRAVGHRVFYSRSTDAHGVEPWVSDGTVPGTRLVRDVNELPPFDARGSSYPYGFVEVGGSVFFAACDGVNGFAVWRTDGTPAGTRLVKDVNPRPIPADRFSDGCLDDRGLPDRFGPSDLVELDGRLLFVADDGVHDAEVWTSDGTAEGSRMLREVVPEPWRFFCTMGFCRGAQVGGLARLSRTLVLFSTTNGLWRTDGSPDGTMRVADRPAGTLWPARTRAYFSGDGVWRTDGTTAGTSLVGPASIPTRRGGGRGPDRESDFETAGDRLFFVGHAPETRYELWTSDGSTVSIVADLAPGSTSSDPASLTAHGEVLYFTADDGAGRQVWVTDGTARGTLRLTDLRGGVAANRPTYPEQDLAVLGDRLLFPGRDAQRGTELWALPIR